LNQQKWGVVFKAIARSDFNKGTRSLADAPKYLMKNAIFIGLRINAIAEP